MLRALLCLLMVWCPVEATFAQEPTGALSGQVVVATSKTPLSDANVVIGSLDRGASTDKNGRFRIEGLPAGTYTIRVSMLGYETVVRPGIEVRPRRTQKLTVHLRPIVITGEEISVTANYFASRNTPRVSARGFRAEEIYRSPGATQDIQRVVQALPGLSFHDDHRNDLIVRGGSPSENLTVLNGIEVPNINHFGSQVATGGPISMVNSSFIEDIDFSTGGFGAEYGGRLSSVLDIRLREGLRERTAAGFDLSMAGAGGSIEGPTDALGIQGSWFLGARRSYLNLLRGALDLTGLPKYGSAYGSATVDFTPADRLTTTALLGTHSINIEPDPDTHEPDADRGVLDRGETAVSGLTWRRLWGAAGFTELTLSVVQQVFRTDVRGAENVLDHRNRSRETTAAAHLNSSWSLSAKSLLEAGLSTRLTGFNHDIYNGPRKNILGEPVPARQLQTEKQTLNSSAYVQFRRTLPGDLTITGGLRHEYLSLLERGHTLSPRLSIHLPITSTLALKAAWGIYRQAPAWVWFSSAEATRAFRPMRADHIVAGLAWQPASAWKLTLEGYEKRYRQIPVAVDQPMISTINQGAAFGSPSIGELEEDGSAHAYGVETLIQRKLTGRFYGSLSYSLSWSHYTPLDGIERPTDFDQRQVGTVVLGANPRPIPWLGLVGGSLQLRYATGAPTTPFNLAKSQELETGVIDYEQVNSERLPDYLRLDVRLDRQYTFRWGSITSYIEVQNVLGRKNAATRLYNHLAERVETHQHRGRFFVGGVRVEI